MFFTLYDLFIRYLILMVVIIEDVGWITEIIILMMKENHEKSTAIKVYVRVRPLVGPELGTN